MVPIHPHSWYQKHVTNILSQDTTYARVPLLALLVSWTVYVPPSILG